MDTRALSFGKVAARYDRFRLGYPPELVDQVLTYAGGPIRTALEIGAGTGKATRAFTARGILVTATDPDPDMLRELRKSVPDNVTALRAAFEELPVTEVYDLVFAAAALHWTNPVQRWSRVAGLLKPGGVFASFGGQTRLADPSVEDAVRAARAPFLEEDGVPSPDGTPPKSEMQWPGTELQRSHWFSDVRQYSFQRRPKFSAREYIGHLSTVSAYLQLPPPQQAQVFDRILRVLPEEVVVVADITLHLARRRERQTD